MVLLCYCRNKSAVFFRNQELIVFFIWLKLCSYYVILLYHWCVLVKDIGIEGNFMKFKRIVDESLDEIKIIKIVDVLRMLIFEGTIGRIHLLIDVYWQELVFCLMFYFIKTLMFYWAFILFHVQSVGECPFILLYAESCRAIADFSFFLL